MAVDRKSITYGVAIGLALGIALSFAVPSLLSNSIFTVEEYTVTVSLSGGGSSVWAQSMWTYGGTVVFVKDNTTIATIPQVDVYNPKNVTLTKGNYIVKLYSAYSGTFVSQREIYVAKDLTIVLDY
jgi:hypothetical protein